MNLTNYSQLFWLLILIPMTYFMFKTLVTRNATYRKVAAVMRVLAVVCLIIALCKPFMVTSTVDKHVIYLLDTSASVDNGAIEDGVKDILESIDLLSMHDSYSIFAYGTQVKEFNKESFSKGVKTLLENINSDSFRGATKLSTTIEKVKLAYPANKNKLLCIFSDGVPTDGSIENSIDLLKEEQVAVLFKSLERFKQQEVAVVGLSPNTPEAYKGEVVKLTAKIKSNYNTTAKLRFTTQGVVMIEKEVELKQNVVTDFTHEFSLTADNCGIWSAEIVGQQDYFQDNNKLDCSVDLMGETKLLLLHDKPRNVREFKKALETQNISVEVRGKYGVPTSFNELSQFDAVMLAEIDASSFSYSQMEMFRSYVEDFGGGMIMTGSESSFGLGGYYKTPIEKVLPITSRYEKEKEQPSMDLILIIDKSGSMSGDPMVLAREAAKSSVELLSARDHVAVIAFDGASSVVVDLSSALNKQTIMTSIDSIAASGGTNMFPAMEQGRDIFLRSTAKVKHMIVLSDGQSSGGDFEGVSAELAANGVTVSTVSLGGGAAVDLMARIAEIGNGRAYVTSKAEEMPRIFTKETIEASKSAIKEDPFVPVVISSASTISGVNMKDAPYLLGYVMTKPRLGADMQLLTENGDPLLAFGAYGLGRTAAFTSDITEQWSSEWLEWSEYSKFWAQIIRSITRNSNNNNLVVSTTKRNATNNIDLTCYDMAGELENHIKWDTMLIDESGQSKKLNIIQDGLGRYSVNYTPPANQSYAVRINDMSNNRIKTLFNVKSYSEEYVLSAVPDTRFSKLNKWDKALKQNDMNRQIYKNIWQYFVLLSMILTLIGIFFRRI